MSLPHNRAEGGGGDQAIVNYFANFQQDTSVNEQGNDDLDGTRGGRGNSPLSLTSPSSTSPTATTAYVPDLGPYPHCPLYIPSKGRGDQERGTLALLVRDLVPFTVVVEPEDGEAYRQLIDRLVFTHFGAAGMSFASAKQGGSADEAPEEHDDSGNSGGGGSPSETAVGRVVKEERAAAAAKGEAEGKGVSPLTNDEDGEEEEADLAGCACCRPAVDKGRDAPLSRGIAQLTANKEHQRLLRKLLHERRQLASALYHHGYVFTPMLHAGTDNETTTEMQKGGRGDADTEERRDENPGTLRHCRRPSPAFALSAVEDVRALFRVVELPRGQQGVSYARNFILQVLVPADMIAARVDRTGHIEELELFGATTTADTSNANSAGGSGSGGGAAMPDSKAYLTEEQLRAAAAASTTTSSTTAAAPSPSRLAPLRQDKAEVAALVAPHLLYGYYWVLDDDIYSFFHARAEGEESESGGPASASGATAAALQGRNQSPQQQQQQRRNVRVSVREMMRQVALRVEKLKQVHLRSQNETGGGGARAVSGSNGNSSGEVSMYQRQQTLLTSFGSHTQQRQPWTSASGIPFTCKEDCIRNNLQPIKRPATTTTSPTANVNSSGSSTGGGGSSSSNSNSSSTTLNLENFTYLPLTACVSLEYSRFAYTYDDDALAVNSYNNIACLFNYHLLHTPRQMHYFPNNVPGIRSTREVLGGGLAFSPASLNRPCIEPEDPSDEPNPQPGQQQQQPEHPPLHDAITSRGGSGGSSSMLWYKFTVREDYDFTLQLIARGMCTLRFRNLSFDVPQMAKLRGGMTDFYKNRSAEIRWQNDLFVRQWPAVAIPWVKGKKGSERDDIKVRWDLLHPARARFPGAFLFLSQPLPQIQQQQQGQPTLSRSGAIAAQASGYVAHHLHDFAPSRTPDPTPHQNQQQLSAPTSVPPGHPAPPPPTGPSLKEVIQRQVQQTTPSSEPPATARAQVRRPGPAIRSGVTWRGKRHWGSDSEEDESDDDDDEEEDEEEALSDGSWGSDDDTSDGEQSVEEKGGRRPVTRHGMAEQAQKVPRTEAALKQHQQQQLLSPPPPLPQLISQQVNRPVQAPSPSMDGSARHGWKGYAVEGWRDLNPAEAQSLGLRVMPTSELRAGATVAVVPPFFAHQPSCVLATLIEREPNPTTGEVEWTAVAQRARGVPILTLPPSRLYVPPAAGHGVEEVAAAVDAFFARARAGKQ